MHRRTYKLAVMTALSIGLAVSAQHVERDAALYQADELKWLDGPKSLPKGAKLAVLEGDPGKEGPFVMRLRLPDGYTIPAHTHPKTERLTVISGTFNIAMGGKLDRNAARKMSAGAFGYWAAGMEHQVWVDGETVVQLHGFGPWSINYLNPSDDPRKK